MKQKEELPYIAKGKAKTIGKIAGIAVAVTAAIPVLTALVYVCFLLVVGPMLNDARAKSYEDQLLSVEVPASVELVESKSICMNVGGTSNHVEIVVGAVVYSELPQQEMETIYKGYNCRPVSTETIRLLQADRVKLFDFSQYENIAGFYLVYCF